MEEKYLPVGTVVLLKDAKVKTMITGYRVNTGEKEFDYCGCMFPYGNNEEGLGVFNHEEIGQIIHMGYVNEDFNKLNEELKTNK